MDQRAYLAISAMLNGFPQGSSDPDVLLRTYEAVLDGVEPTIIADTAKRFTSGEVEGQSATFAPSVAQFNQEARRLADIRSYRDRRALPSPNQRGGTPPFIVAREKAKTKFDGWTVFKKDIGYDEFRNLSKSRAIPVGGVWCAALATVFLPPE